MPEFSAEFSEPPEFSGGAPEKHLCTGWAQSFDLQITNQSRVCMHSLCYLLEFSGRICSYWPGFSVASWSSQLHSYMTWQRRRRRRMRVRIPSLDMNLTLKTYKTYGVHSFKCTVYKTCLCPVHDRHEAWVWSSSVWLQWQSVPLSSVENCLYHCLFIHLGGQSAYRFYIC